MLKEMVSLDLLDFLLISVTTVPFICCYLLHLQVRFSITEYRFLDPQTAGAGSVLSDAQMLLDIWGGGEV